MIHTPLWLQKVDELDPDIDYTGKNDRHLIESIFGEGVLGAGSFVVSQRGAGANFTVDVTAGVAVIDGDDELDQGTYLLWSDAVENVTVPAAPGANSRIDLVVLEVNDEQAGGPAGVALGRIRVVAGTPAGSPVAPAVPDSAIALATIGPITTLTTAITDGMITDARETARMRYDLIDAGQVTEAKLGDGAVTTAKIGDEQVTAAKLGAGAVTTAKIGDSQVTTAKIGDSQVTAAKIGAGAVTTAKIGDNQVTEVKLATAVLSSAWTALAAATGWTALSDPSGLYYKKIGNVVFVAGGISRDATGSPTSNQTMATLPVGFRPPATHYVSAYALSGDSGFKPVSISSTGAITVVGSFGNGVASSPLHFTTAFRAA